MTLQQLLNSHSLDDVERLMLDGSISFNLCSQFVHAWNNGAPRLHTALFDPNNWRSGIRLIPKLDHTTNPAD